MLFCLLFSPVITSDPCLRFREAPNRLWFLAETCDHMHPILLIKISNVFNAKVESVK